MISIVSNNGTSFFTEHRVFHPVAEPAAREISYDQINILGVDLRLKKTPDVKLPVGVHFILKFIITE